MLRFGLCWLLCFALVPSACFAYERGDANEDGEVDTDDRDDMISPDAPFSKPGSRTWADGDFNGDGCVTDYDICIWHLNRTDQTTLEGDYNDNGIVDQADADLVLLNWGKTYPATGPEEDIIDSTGPTYDQRVDPIANTWTTRWYHDPPSGTIDQAEYDKVLLNWGNTR